MTRLAEQRRPPYRRQPTLAEAGSLGRSVRADRPVAELPRAAQRKVPAKDGVSSATMPASEATHPTPRSVTGPGVLMRRLPGTPGGVPNASHERMAAREFSFTVTGPCTNERNRRVRHPIHSPGRDGTHEHRRSQRIRLVGVTKVDDAGADQVRALGSVDVEFATGALAALLTVHPGSGKSALMHCLDGLDQLRSGSADVDNDDLTTLLSTATPAKCELKRIANPGGYLRTVVNLYVHCTTQHRSTCRHDIDRRRSNETVDGTPQVPHSLGCTGR